jgi:hypothetical protein
MTAGRPTKYKPEYAKQAAQLCELGATDYVLSRFFEVHLDTIHEWRSVHKEFSDAIKTNKAGYDDVIERSLAMRAAGYTCPETDIRVIDGRIVATEIIKHYPPDSRAALAWLYNRRHDKWRPIPQPPAESQAIPEPVIINVIDASADADS